MNARIRTLPCCLGAWAAFVATSTAQLQLRHEPEPRPRTDLIAPRAPEQAAPAQQPVRVLRQGQMFGNAVILNGANVIGNFVIAGDEGGEAAKVEPDPSGTQVIDYTDGQRLHGKLSSLDLKGGQMIWLRPDAAAPISIPASQITRWTSEDDTASEVKTGATVKFTGSDWLIANVTAIQGDKVNLQLPDGTKLSTTRSHLEWIYFSKAAAIETYDGPTSLAGWTSGGNWTYREGALRATSPSAISRNFQALPDQVEYSMLINQGETINAFTLSLHSRNVGVRGKGMNRGLLQLMLRASTLNLWASIDGNFKSVQVDISKQFGDPARRAKEAMLFRVFEDFTNGRVLVYLNGRKAAEWSIDKGEPGQNGGIFQFQPTSWSGENEQSISRIRILPWDGQDPGEDEERIHDSVALTGGDVKRGRLTSWDGRALKVATDHGPVTVPADQIGLVRFQRPENPPDDAAPVAHLRLAGRGEFDAIGLDWRDGKFVVRTNFGGELALAPAAVTELEFNRPASKPAPAENVLAFRNGDRLRGSLVSADADGKLRWRTGPGAPSVEFAPTFVAGVQFSARTPGPPGAMVARFRNGDWLTGSFLTLDPQQLVLDAPEVGQLTVPRPSVKALYFNTNGTPAVSDGVSDHEIWERGLDMNSGNSELRKKLGATGSPWNYFAGTFSRSRPGANDAAYSRLGGIQLGRVFETMASRVEASFTVKVDRMPLFFSLQLFTEPSNPGYMLHVSNGGLSLYDMNPRPMGRGITQQQFPYGKDVNPTARERQIRIFADRTSGRMTILVDGVVTAQVIPKGTDGPRKLGRGIMITPQPNMAFTVSDLWVGPWNGVVPGKTPAADAAPATVELANGDEVQGTVELGTPTTMKVASDVGALELPMDRLTMVDFGGQPIGMQPGTRLHFAGQGALTISAWRIENETLICRSEIAGELKLPLKAVQEIVFAPPSVPAK